MTAAPTKVDDGPALVEDHLFDADGTRYRVIVVHLGDGNGRLVLAEPAGEFGQLGPRRYMPLNDEADGVLSQDYVGEKLGYKDYTHVDCYNMTLLIGYALHRPVLVCGPDGYYERRDPAW
jgi:hypothetical protein